LNDAFPSQPRRPSNLSIISFPFDCSSLLNNPVNPCIWPIYTRRLPVSVALASAKVQVLSHNRCRLRCASSCDPQVLDETGAPLPNITVHMVPQTVHVMYASAFLTCGHFRRSSYLSTPLPLALTRQPLIFQLLMPIVSSLNTTCRFMQTVFSSQKLNILRPPLGRPHGPLSCRCLCLPVC
jgi:hypothetical protein